MASYYYLMSSLPTLNANGQMPFRYDAFLDMCRSSVSESTYKRLEELNVNSSEGALMAEWSKFYRILSDELTYQRSLRLGRNCPAPADRDSDATRIASAALNEKNPLTAEKLLLELQFEKLDGLTNMHWFDEISLIGYALKLKLMERRTVFDHDRGKAEFGRIFDYLQQQIEDFG